MILKTQVFFSITVCLRYPSSTDSRWFISWISLNLRDLLPKQDPYVQLLLVDLASPFRKVHYFNQSALSGFIFSLMDIHVGTLIIRIKYSDVFLLS